MPLHPTVAEFIASLPAPPPGPLNPGAMRAFDESHVPPLEERLVVGAVFDTVVPGDTGDVPVRVYEPSLDAAGTRGAGPVVVYCHGGAFFLGSLNTHDHVCRELALATGSTVVSVGYRLAPEHPFPAGLMDCVAVVRSVIASANPNKDAVIRWDGSTLAIAGDSSGANFATVVAAIAHDDGLAGITHQVLFYPSVDLDFDENRYASLRTNAVGYGLETAGLKPFNSFYVESGADPSDPLVSPIKRADLSGLPPALIFTAEFDPLRDEGEEYGRRLAAAGVPTTVRRYESAGHGFVQHFSWLPEFHSVFAETGKFIRSAHV
jgi:acetyl esterase